MPAQTIDDAHAQLHAAGWSIGDISTLNLAGRRTWNVYLHRAEQRIVSRAPTQREAWAEAWRMAEGVDCR